MTKPKTRCSECLYTKNKATQEPCDKCSEIQYPFKKFENHFVVSDRTTEVGELK